NSPDVNPEPDTTDQDRQQVEDWLTQQRNQAERFACGFDNHTVVHDLVSALLGQPHDGLVLDVLARDSGKKLLDRKSYDDHPPQLPLPLHDGGCYYPMYDAHGTLVAWIHDSQLAGVIAPDYPPVQATASEPTLPSEATLVDASRDTPSSEHGIPESA